MEGTYEVRLPGIGVRVANGDINGALKKLKKRVFDAKILIDVQRHREYEKPSERKRRKRNESINRMQRERSKLLKERGY